MKQSLITLSLLFMFTHALPAQDSILLRRYFKVNLILLNGSESKGWLGVLSDTSIGLSQKPVTMQVIKSPKYPYQKINYSEIEGMTIKRKSSIGRGIFYGSMIGVLTGFLAGVVQGSDPDYTETLPEIFGNGYYSYTVKGMSALDKGAAGAFAGGLSGAVIGGIVGAVAHKTFIIQGKKKNFTEMRGSLLTKVYSTKGP